MANSAPTPDVLHRAAGHLATVLLHARPPTSLSLAPSPSVSNGTQGCRELKNYLEIIAPHLPVEREEVFRWPQAALWGYEKRKIPLERWDLYCVVGFFQMLGLVPKETPETAPLLAREIGRLVSLGDEHPLHWKKRNDTYWTLGHCEELRGLHPLGYANIDLHRARGQARIYKARIYSGTNSSFVAVRIKPWLLVPKLSPWDVSYNDSCLHQARVLRLVDRCRERNVAMRLFALPTKHGFYEEGLHQEIRWFGDTNTLWHFLCYQRTAVSEEKRYRIALALLKPQAVLHRMGYVHGDPHPGNYFIEMDHVDIGAVLGDFDSSEPTDRKASMPHSFVTNESPNSLKDRVITPRDEVFSLAVFVTMILTGKHPLGIWNIREVRGEDSDLPTLLSTLLERHQNRPSPDLTGLPEPVAKCLRRALAPQRRDRYPDAFVFRKALARAVRRSKI